MKKIKKPQLRLVKEFKAFITKGNVVDLAVGMIVGAAFTAIVTALVNNIFKPLINWIPIKDGLNGLITMLKPVYVDGVVDMTQSVYIDWGAFLMAIVNFLLTAMVLFAIIKFINALRDGFSETKSDAEFLKTLTKEELAELKKGGLNHKEIEELRAKKAEEAALAAEAEKVTEPEPETMEDVLKQIRDLLLAQAERDASKQNETNGDAE